MPTILVIENDRALADEIRVALSSHWEPLLVRKWQVGRSYLQHEPIAVAVMRLPEPERGEAVAQMHGPAPIIVYGPRSERNAVMASGAYQYLPTPLDVARLIQAVRTASRRVAQLPPATEQTLRFGKLVIDPPSVDAFFDRQSLELTPSEFKLVSALATAGRVMAREELIEISAGREKDSGRVIDVMIMRIRAKLRAKAPEWVFIHAEPGRGYEFRPISAAELDSARRAFNEDVLPSIVGLPASRLATATGLSYRYCHAVKRGECTPHQRHWEAFRRAGELA